MVTVVTKKSFMKVIKSALIHKLTFETETVVGYPNWLRRSTVF